MVDPASRNEPSTKVAGVRLDLDVSSILITYLPFHGCGYRNTPWAGRPVIAAITRNDIDNHINHTKCPFLKNLIYAYVRSPIKYQMSYLVFLCSD